MIMQDPFIRKLAPTGVFFALVFVILITGTNEALFLSLNGVAQALPPGLWSNITFLADGTAGVALMTLLIRNHIKLVFWAIWGAILTSILVNLLKQGFAIARPPAVLDPETFRTIGAALRAGSFPSGHTTTAFFLAALVASVRTNRLWILSCLIMALVFGWSRIAVGVHWPMDIMAGAGLGWFMGAAVVAFADRKPELVFWQRLVTISVCLTFSLYLFVFDAKLPYVLMLQYSLASLGTGICARAFILEAVGILERRSQRPE